MSYSVSLLVNARPKEVFDATHRYKIEKKPNKFFMGFLTGFIFNMEFKVLTPTPLGLGATYAWSIKAFGIPVLKFKEKVIKWQEGKTVVYKAISGWKGLFRLDFGPYYDHSTLVKVSLDYITNFEPFNNLPRFFVEPMLKLYCQRIIKRGLIS